MIFFELKHCTDKNQNQVHSYNNAIKSAGDGQISFIANFNSPLSYFFEIGDKIVIGEATSKISQVELEAIIKENAENKVSSNQLSNKILSLFIISLKDKTINAVCSISSSRTYYYFFDQNRFICSTHVKEMALADLKLEKDENHLGQFYLYRYVVPPNTLYKNIKSLTGGESKEFDLSDNSISTSKFFDFHTDTKQETLSDYKISSKCDSILENNILETKSITDSCGTLLSGGLDSSLLAQLAVNSKAGNSSYSTSFKFINESDMEDNYATSASKHIGTNHSIVSGSKIDYLLALVDATYFAEVPVHHLQSVMLYILFKSDILSGEKVLLCGQIADGLFGNDFHIKYNKYKAALSFLNITQTRYLLKIFMSLTRSEQSRLSYFGNYFGSSSAPNDNILWTLGQFTSPEIVREYFDFDESELYDGHRQLVAPYQNLSMYDKLSLVTLFCEGQVAMSIWGQLAESENIFLHYPFASKDMISFIFSINWDKKLKEKKYYIREMLRNCSFPEQYINRNKKSFGFPSKFWAVPNSLFQPIVDMATENNYVEFDLRKLQTEDPGQSMLLWNIISLFLWEQLMIDGIDKEDLKNEISDRHNILENKKQ